MYKLDFGKLPLKTLTAFLLSITLAACGGGDNDSRLDGVNNNGGTGGNTGGDSTGGDSTGDDNSGDEDENEPAQLGRGSADSFVSGEIEVGIGNSTLSPGGSTTLAVTMVNGAGELITSAVDVTFNSDCIASGSAILSSSGEDIGSTVSTNNGRAEITYSANGCNGDDQVTARATYNGVSAGSARTTLTVESDTVQTLEFIGADPELISLKGTGGPETSKVTFRVLGSTGSPMRDVDVNFALSPGGSGGLALVNATDTSNNNGEVSTTVQSGTVATSVRVTASTTAESGEISTQSSRLAVSTGIPDQNSVSLAADNPYPTAWRHDGEESQLTIRLADAFNNPAPDGTAVSFTTSGGAVDGSCITTDGACTVTWKSQNPRPEPSQGFAIDEDTFSVTCPDDRECRPGRVMVIATSLGNESFVDTNSNGLYDHEVDIFLADNAEGQCDPNVPRSYAAVDVAGCDDLGTAYLDKNFTGEREEGEEIYALSSSESGSDYESGDGIYNGVLCSDASFEAEECTRNSVTVREDIMLVMACEEPYVMADGGLPGQRSSVDLALGESTTLTMMLADCNGNGMPAGTTIELVTGSLENVNAEVIPDGELAGAANPSSFDIQLTASEEGPASGTVRISITAPAPNGELTTTIGQGITIN